MPCGFTFYTLLPLSLLIQLLGVSINPWVFLAQIQAEFGGEFFLENTAALYDFRYSQIVGQLQAWSLENSDLAWLRWGFDPLAFGLSLVLVLLSGWLLWRSLAREPGSRGAGVKSPPLLRTPAPLLLLTLVITTALLARYYHTDLQFDPPDDAYTEALEIAAAQSAPGDHLLTVAQYHYHLPMNRFRARLPLTGFAQQSWPPPETALPLLTATANAPNIWLVTVGFPPAAADNATEQWLARHAFKASDQWFGDSVRLVRYTATPPTVSRPLRASFGPEAIALRQIRLLDPASAGQPLPVEFEWQPAQPPQANYNLFLQLLNRDGALVAQHDSPPGGGYHPATTWPAAETITSRHALPLPTDLPPGDYRLIAGLYDPTTGQRLPVNDGADFVELGNVTIMGGD